MVGGSDAVLVIDDTAITKKGTHSVGVLRNMLRRWARLPTARPWYACARRSTSHANVAAISSPGVGRASGLGWSERVFRPNIERHERNRRWFWSIVPSRPVCALAAS